MPAWSHEDDRELLLAIIDCLPTIVPKYKEVEERMRSRGHAFTHEGIRQRYQKLRKEYSASTATSSSSSTLPPVTPKKRNRATPNKKKSADFDDGDPDEDFSATPSKRKKATPRKLVRGAMEPMSPPEEEEEGGRGNTVKVKAEGVTGRERARVKIEQVDGEGRVMVGEDDDLYE